jgi:GTP diphosphokinase / guanosine-3',5'-bis(diphosphate) 3'-diphosphatase
VTGRPKHYYSIYQKMIVRGRDFTDIYDLVGIRVLVESVRDCYAVLGILHARWNPVPGRFKDWIAMPKFNMYQSLHTTVIGPGRQAGRAADPHLHDAPPCRVRRRRALEVQGGQPAARGQRHDRATTTPPTWPGCASCWTGRRRPDPGEFLESLRFEVSSTEVYVFTPRGDVKPLPTGSTPVDFAYAVHTEVGPPLHRGEGQRPAGAAGLWLDNGDVVEVFTSKAEGAGPSRDWLGFVVARARNKIKQWFSKERREEAIEPAGSRSPG